jgi:hypothetical protein
MADSNPTDRCIPDLPTPSDEDRKVERAVLSFMLDEHPNRLTFPEVSWALNAGTADFASEDAVERAVRELVGAGLLRHEGGYVLPTRAAMYQRRLEE